jgi:RNA polymerase sigma-70 factor (ECF subfamily)
MQVTSQRAARALPDLAPPGASKVRVYAAQPVSDAVGDAVMPGASASQQWLDDLASSGPARDKALARLHELLLRGAHHEIRRRRAGLRDVSRGELDDLALQATADAMVAILAKLHTFRGESQFTTWAYKFVLLEAAVKLRRRAWQGREVMLDDQAWPRFADAGPSAQQTVEDSELLEAIRTAMATALTPHQREVFTALALNGVPIDVLAERLNTTRGALYKTLHDARRKLRARLATAGLDVGATSGRTA